MQMLSYAMALFLSLGSQISMGMAPPSPYDDTSSALLPTAHLTIPADKSAGSKYKLDAWVPAQSGNYPVWFFETGLGGICPPDAYREMMEKIAARGIIAISPRVGLPSPKAARRVGREFVQTIDWLHGHLDEAIQRSGAVPAGVRGRMDQLVAGAHSSAVQTIMEVYRYIGPQLMGFLLIDPVNRDPMNMTEPAIGEDEYFDNSAPVLLLASGLGNQPGVNLGKLWPPCAPDDSSAKFFFQRFSGPKWYVEASDYGHADMLGGIYLRALRTTRFCKVAESFDPGQYRTFLAGAIASYFRVLTGNGEDMRKHLEDSRFIPVRSQVMTVR
jgi:hypothetical protein